MKRMADDLKYSFDSDRIDKVGFALINNYASIDLAADELNITPAYLRHLISTNPELQVYFEIAHEGLKGLTDKEVIKKLQMGDEKIVKMVFNKLYAGRERGGYNPAEFGTRGYNDPLSKKIAQETEKDRKKGQITVQFNFIEREGKTVDMPRLEEGFVDAEEITDEDESSN